MEVKKLVNDIYCGDNVTILETLEDDSVDEYVFSPPYDGIRDYEGYSMNLHKLGVQVKRTLKPGGVTVCVIQDQTKDSRKSLTTFRTVIDWIDNIGLKLWECAIYMKTGRPGPWWTKRLRVDHEYILIFFKGDKPQYFNKEHMKVLLKKPYNRRGGDRKTDGGFTKSAKKRKGAYGGPGTLFKYKTSGQESIPDKDLKLTHPATYPDQLAIDFIKMFCPPGGIVVDPFLGSGTTAVAAIKCDRKYIGIDISEEYCQIAKKRIKLNINHAVSEKKLDKLL